MTLERRCGFSGGNDISILVCWTPALFKSHVEIRLIIPIIYLWSKWLIYLFQDPSNFDEPYFNHEIFVERIYSGDNRDEDPEETGFELSEESEISSESF